MYFYYGYVVYLVGCELYFYLCMWLVGGIGIACLVWIICWVLLILQCRCMWMMLNVIFSGLQSMEYIEFDRLNEGVQYLSIMYCVSYEWQCDEMSYEWNL